MNDVAAPPPAEPAAGPEPPKKRCRAASKIEDSATRSHFRVRLQNGTSKGFHYTAETRPQALREAESYMREHSSDWQDDVE